jgi:hypothetical protein
MSFIFACMCALVFIGILLHASSRVYEASLQVNNIVASPVNGHIDVVHGAELSMNRVAASMITSVKSEKQSVPPRKLARLRSNARQMCILDYDLHIKTS